MVWYIALFADPCPAFRHLQSIPQVMEAGWGLARFCKDVDVSPITLLLVLHMVFA